MTPRILARAKAGARQELGSGKEGKIVKMGNKVGPNRHIIGTFR